ncbi:hypothetical protein Adt_18998 [Abeliophyllum distichum]|uniref:Uncharacterized protein n=1 Tax=Abeliophyllum distichum TaxID=126358 RepID=A0ABD1TLA9_9LAMI
MSWIGLKNHKKSKKKKKVEEAQGGVGWCSATRYFHSSVALLVLQHRGDAALGATGSASTISANINSIPILNGSNFKHWKENIMIVLGCMDLDLALRTEQPPALTTESSTEAKRDIEKWNRSNRMSLMIMKRSIPETFRGSISEEQNADKFLKDIEQRFAKNEKSETSTLLDNLISMRYKGKGNIREYIMEMSNLTSKLKALKLELSEDLLVHLVLISLPAQYGQFKVSYNTQKDKWTLNELISHCVQEEERLKKDRTEGAHLSTNPRDKKRKRKLQLGHHNKNCKRNRIRNLPVTFARRVDT